MHSAIKRERIDQFVRLCRERGLPVTMQRRSVFQAILDREDHPTADQIHDQVRGRVPDISRTTVYRILDTLVQLGLINKICHHGAAARFDPKIHQHHHLVCMSCEKIIDIEDERLNKLGLPDTRGEGFEISDYHIHFRGICADCHRRLGKPRSSARGIQKPTGASAKKRKPATRSRKDSGR